MDTNYSDSEDPDLFVGMTQKEISDYENRLSMKKQDNEIGSAFSEWFSKFQCDWFLTVTFPPRPGIKNHTIEWCRRCLNEHLIEAFSEKLWGRRWRKRGKGLFGYIVWEKNVRGAWHAHLLVSGTRGRPQREVIACCKKHPVLGYATCSTWPLDEQKKYVAKNLNKGDTTWEIFGNWRGFCTLPECGKLQNSGT